MPRRKWMVVTALVSGLAVGGIAISVFGSSGSTGASTEQQSVASESLGDANRPVVRAQQVTALADAGDETYTGVVRARYETNLAFRVSGKIIKRHVEVGQLVSAGAPLFDLDPSDFQLALKAAEADLAAAEAEATQTSLDERRIHTLHDRKVATSAERDQSRSLRDTAQGRRNRARENLKLAVNKLSYCQLSADKDGVILSLPAESGQVVSEGLPVASLAHFGDREAVINLPENRAASAHTARAVVTLWSAPGEHYSAQLRELSPVADPGTRTYQARFTILEPSSSLMLGMTATVHLTPSGSMEGYAVPLTSLARAEGRPAVWIVNPTTGALKLSTVTVLEYRNETAVLTTGVAPGDWVVTAGVQKLDAGLQVRLWEGNR